MARLRALLFSLCLLLTASAVHADGWYLGGFATYSDADEVEFGTGLGTVKTTFDTTTGFGLSFGREVGNFRIEGEWSLRDFDVEDHFLGGAALPGPTGSLDAQTYFVNAYYDFNRSSWFNPYLGAGLGLADVELDGFGVAPIPDVLDDSDQAFAYQLIAGLGFRLDESWALFVDYRYVAADGLSITVSPAAGSVGSDVDFNSQDLTAGVRFVF